MTLRLSTSTNLYCERPGGGLASAEQMLRMASEAGFRLFDMSFYEWSEPGGPFVSENWRDWIFRIREQADRLGVAFEQSHAHTYHFLSPNMTWEQRLWQEELVRRSLDCCQILGVKTVVTHPDMDGSKGDMPKDTWEKNREYLGRLLEEADRRGMGLSVENMWDYPGHPGTLFFSQPEEIKAFVDWFGDSRLGVCWDFEHGTILGLDQPEAVRCLGRRLTALHVSDTTSKEFEPFMHVLPFSGTTAWEPIIRALKEIGYGGVFSFEAHNFIKKLPDELVGAALRYAWQVGDYLVRL